MVTLPRRVLMIVFAMAMFVAACTGNNTTAPPLPTLTVVNGPSATDVPATILIPEPSITPLPPANQFYIDGGVPGGIAGPVTTALINSGWQQTGDASNPLRVIMNPPPEAALTAEWVYVLVAPFPTVVDNVTWASFLNYWANGAMDGLPDFGGPPRIVLLGGTGVDIGQPSSAIPINLLAEAEPSELVDLAWGNRPALSIIPFNQLEPRWKVLSVDGMSPLDRSLDTSNYPLAVRVGVVAEGEIGAQGLNLLQSSGAWQSTNRDPAKLTSVVMNGVVALDRATAMQIETRGVAFPAQEIAPFFADADILHLSNESSFTPDCREPDWYGAPSFCSKPAYFALFENIGVDIVEVTGNHIKDFGVATLTYTLDTYDNNALPYFGGGRNLDDAKAARILNLPDGTRVAFIGCNSAGPFPAWASAESPGAAPCEDWGWITNRITSLKANGEADVVVVTLQYLELDRYDPTDQQRADFEALAVAGADIVSGSQAHWPQGFSFVGGEFVHFGVGNLFFDQIDLEGNRQMFADKHVFYEGRHISTILFTGYFETIGQPRPMTPEERAAFLQRVFAASSW